MADFHIKKEDTGPRIRATVLDGSGKAVDIAGAAVRFHMKPWEGGVLTVDSVASNDQVGDGLDTSKGKVSYDWQVGNTDAVGLYRAEFEVTFSGGKIETFPNDSDIVVEVRDDVDAP